MTVHEVLVKARNGAEHDGWDAWDYGGGCGTPRCALGWVGWFALGQEAFQAVSLDSLMGAVDTPANYRAALEALWNARPVDYVSDPGFGTKKSGLGRDVELVAYHFDEDVDGVLKWFDKAIAATAPEPADPFHETLQAEARVHTPEPVVGS